VRLDRGAASRSSRSTDLGVTSPDPSWGEHFQARQLSGPPLHGAFRYADPFGRL